MSPWVAEVLSDLGLLARALHEVNIYHPWAAGFDHEFVNFKEDIDLYYTQNVSSFWTQVQSHMRSVSVAELGNPSDGKFKYPFHGRRTEKNTNALRHAESNLDRFWLELDRQHKKVGRRTLEQGMGFLCCEQRQLERTPEWVETTKGPQRQPHLPVEPEELARPFVAFSFNDQQSTSKLFPQPKFKVKTRGIPQESIKSESDNQDAGQPQDRQPKFTLANRAYKVFKALFYTPSLNDPPGEIAWADFLHAITTVGFAVEKLYGSIC